MISGKRVRIFFYLFLIFWDVSSFSWVERELGANKKEVGWGIKRQRLIGHARFEVSVVLSCSNNKQADSSFLGKRPRLERQCGVVWKILDFKLRDMGSERLSLLLMLCDFDQVIWPLWALALNWEGSSRWSLVNFCLAVWFEVYSYWPY